MFLNLHTVRTCSYSRVCSCAPSQSLRNVVMALTASIIPVMNAYLVLLIAMCICESSSSPCAYVSPPHRHVQCESSSSPCAYVSVVLLAPSIITASPPSVFFERGEEE